MSIPKSVVNPLSDLYQLIEKGKILKKVEHRGKTFTFRSLFDSDYTWRDQFMNMNSPAVMLSSMRTPTLAIATVAIDDVPVEQIDGLDQLDEAIPPSVKENLRTTKYLIAYNLREFFEQLPRDYIEELYDKFVTEVEIPSRIIPAEELKNS